MYIYIYTYKMYVSRYTVQVPQVLALDKAAIHSEAVFHTHVSEVGFWNDDSFYERRLARSTVNCCNGHLSMFYIPTRKKYTCYSYSYTYNYCYTYNYSFRDSYNYSYNYSYSYTYSYGYSINIQTNKYT